MIPVVHGQAGNVKNAQKKLVVEISKKEIEEYKKDPAFDYTVKPKDLSWFDKAVLWVQKAVYKFLFKILEWLMGGEKAYYVIGKMIQLLPYISILFFLYILFKYLLGVDLLKWRGKKEYKTGQVYTTEEERIIKEEDLDSLIKEAVQKEDYRLAVRYYYLLLLKRLSEQNFIQWKPEKTNHQYIKELGENSLRELFSNLTKVYDYIWYGKHKPQGKDFRLLEQEFNKFLQGVKKV